MNFDWHVEFTRIVYHLLNEEDLLHTCFVKKYVTSIGKFVVPIKNNQFENVHEKNFFSTPVEEFRCSFDRFQFYTDALCQIERRKHGNRRTNMVSGGGTAGACARESGG